VTNLVNLAALNPQISAACRNLIFEV